MFIAEKYSTALNSLAVMSNEEFVVHQIWHLQHVFTNDIAAIKNTDCEFIAFTKAFAEEFEAGSDLLGKTAVSIYAEFEAHIYENINHQELEIIKTAKSEDYLYLHKKNDTIIVYAVRKRPLVNPSTGDCVGILINTIKLKPNAFRGVLDNQVLHNSKSKSVLIEIGLSKLQQQIMFCLLLGFSSRKEITNKLSSLTGLEYNETQVKNSLQALYHKFECNTPGQLVDMVTSGKIKLDIPADMLPTGAFPLKEK
jgi:hypothetical protein